MRQLVYTMFITNITLPFTCGEKKIWLGMKQSQNIMSMIVVIKLIFLHIAQAVLLDILVLIVNALYIWMFDV